MEGFEFGKNFFVGLLAFQGDGVCFLVDFEVELGARL